MKKELKEEHSLKSVGLVYAFDMFFIDIILLIFLVAKMRVHMTIKQLKLLFNICHYIL